MTAITTILADDAALVRTTLVQLLALEPDIDVVGEFDSGTAALAGIRAIGPSVAVLDIDMPGMDGVAVAGALAREGSPTRSLILSSITAAGTFQAAMDAGVSGYIAKTAPSYRMAEAIRAVARGERYLDLDLADDVSHDSRPGPLTPREQKILRASKDRRSIRDIGEQLCLSADTVGVVIGTLMTKTGGRNQSEAVRIAAQRGWI